MIEQAQIAELYERYGHALYRRCLTLVSNPDDAHELMQEAFFQFWRGRERFEGRSSVFTYLYRIATNLSIDRLRRRKTAGHQIEYSKAEPMTPSVLATDRQAEAASELAELTVGLDEETITVAVLLHVDGMTQEEIATALDLSRRTVGKRLQKFLSHTRKRAVQVETHVTGQMRAGEGHG